MFQDSEPVSERVLTPLEQPAPRAGPSSWTALAEAYIRDLAKFVETVRAPIAGQAPLAPLALLVAQYAAPSPRWDVTVNAGEIQYSGSDGDVDVGYVTTRVRGDYDVYMAVLECELPPQRRILWHVHIASKSDEMWIGVGPFSSAVCHQEHDRQDTMCDKYSAGLRYEPHHLSYYGGRARAGTDLLARKAALFETAAPSLHHMDNVRLPGAIGDDQRGDVHSGFNDVCYRSPHCKIETYGAGDTVSLLVDTGLDRVDAFLNGRWQFTALGVPLSVANRPCRLFAALDEQHDSVALSCDLLLPGTEPPAWLRKFFTEDYKQT